MPRYSFKVQDKEGRSRHGNVQASSIEEARKMIVSKGFSIEELVEGSLSGMAAMDSGKLSYARVKSAGGIRIEPAAPRDYRPTFWDFVERFRPDQPMYTGVMAICFILGSLYLLAHLVHTPAVPKKAAPKPDQVRFQGAGSVFMEGIPDYGDVTLVIDFPQVPYQKSGKWSDFQHPSHGRFTFDVEFQCAHAPNRFQVRALKPGYKESVSQPVTVPLVGGKVQVGELRLLPARK